MQNTPPPEAPIAITTRMDAELYDWLAKRARHNRRSISSESAMILEERRAADSADFLVGGPAKRADR